MVRKILATIALVLVVVAAVVASLRSNSTSTTSGLSVVTSYYPMYDFAKQVGGNNVSVTNMTPAGAEPHDFEPSAKELAAAQKAKVFIYNGGTLEPWALKFRQDYQGVAVRASDHITIKVGQGEAEPEHTTGAESGPPNRDPHFWLDPVLAQQIVTNIRDGFSRADPAHKTEYAKNAAAFNRRLAQLDTDYRQGLEQCAQRTIVVSHQSMGYVAARYNLRVEAIAGLSPDSEPNPSRIAELTKLVQTEGIHYVFFESLVSPRLADTIAKETGAHTLVLDPIEGLTDEAQKAGKNYLSVQRDNLKNLRLALACQ